MFSSPGSLVSETNIEMRMLQILAGSQVPRDIAAPVAKIFGNRLERMGSRVPDSNSHRVPFVCSRSRTLRSAKAPAGGWALLSAFAVTNPPPKMAFILGHGLRTLSTGCPKRKSLPSTIARPFAEPVALTPLLTPERFVRVNARGPARGQIVGRQRHRCQEE